MTVEDEPALRDGWSARTWLLLAVGFWILRAIALAADLGNVGDAFGLLAVASLAGLVWRLLRGR